MKKKLVYICSPLRGDYEKNINAAKEICREVVTKYPDIIPIAPHIYFTQFLDDTKPNERSLGMEAGIELLDMCDELWVYGIESPSEGMQAEMEYALKNGIKIYNGYHIDMVRELTEEELGDALLIIPNHYGDVNGMAATVSTSVRISGELVMEMATELRRHKGSDITVGVEQ